MDVIDIKTGRVYEIEEPVEKTPISLVGNNYVFDDENVTFVLRMNNAIGKIIVECDEGDFFTMQIEPDNYLYMFRSYFIVGIKFINQAEIYLFGV